MIAGERERAIEHFERSMQLDPMDAYAFHTYYGVALQHFFTIRYEESLAWIDKALLDRPNYVLAVRLKVAASAMAGRSPGEIQEAIVRLRALDPEPSIAKIMQRIAHLRQLDLEFYAKALRLAGLPE